MKRIIAIAILVVMAATLFVGCSSSNSSSDVKLSNVLADINKKFPDSVKGLSELKEKSDLTRYYEIEEKEVADFAAEINTDSSKAAMEIVLVKAKDSKAKTDIEQKLTIRYNSIVSQYASYSAKQLKMAKDGGVKTSGDYVYLVVAEDSDGIFKLIKEELS